MAEALFPVFEVPNVVEKGAEYDKQYKRSVKWDIKKGDFVRDGAGRIMECEGREAFMIWCFKAAQTERYTCLAYSSEIGVEMETATANHDERTVESMVQRTITDSLMVNPRTEFVRDFVFSWEGDKMYCSFHVKGIEWDDIFEISL